MAGTLNTVSELSVSNVADGERRLLVRGNRVFLTTGATTLGPAVRAFDVNPDTGVLTDVPNPLPYTAWGYINNSADARSSDVGLLSSWDLLDQPKTALLAKRSSVDGVSQLISVDLSVNYLTDAVLNGTLTNTTYGKHVTCRPDGLVTTEINGGDVDFGPGQYIVAINVITNTVYKMSVGGLTYHYTEFWAHPTQSYIYCGREIETPLTGTGARAARVFNFAGTAMPTINTVRNDDGIGGDGGSLYTNTFPSQVPLTPDPGTNIPDLGCGWQPWPGHPDYLISFFNRKTPGTTPEVQAWIGFMNVSSPTSFTFEASLLVSGSGKWVLNRNNEVLAHTCWSGPDGTFAFLRVVEYGVERLLKVHVATGIPHDSWAFASGHYPSQYTSGPDYAGLHGEFVTAAGWYGTMYRNEMHILGKINGAPKKFYFPTHWDAILRTGR